MDVSNWHKTETLHLGKEVHPWQRTLWITHFARSLLAIRNLRPCLLPQINSVTLTWC